jgi:hypothetical protein
MRLADGTKDLALGIGNLVPAPNLADGTDALVTSAVRPRAAFRFRASPAG